MQIIFSTGNLIYLMKLRPQNYRYFNGNKNMSEKQIPVQGDANS